MAGLLEKIGLKKQKEKISDKAGIKISKKDNEKKNKLEVKKEPQLKIGKKPEKEQKKNRQKKASGAESGTSKRKIGVDNAYQVLLGFLDTEKSSRENQIGKYYFRVSPKSGKRRIKKAIEEYYGVKVSSVNIMNYKSKKKKFRFIEGTRSAYKKAVVTLEEGESIK